MLKSRTILLSGLAILAIASCTEKKSRVPKQYTIDQLYNNLSVGAAGFNADETKILVDNNSNGIFNIYELNSKDTSSRPLTRSKTDSYFAVDYLPGSNEFIYSADKGGNENSHLYLMKQGDTAAKDLTPWSNSKNSFAGWSTDKKSMYVSSNQRNPQFFDLWKLDTTTWKPVMLYENKDGLDFSDISKSERYIALSKSITTDKNELYLFDRITKTTKRLSNDSEAKWYPTGFEKNDSIMYYITSDGSEFTYLVKYNINNGTAEKVFEDKWDVAGMNLSENEKYHTIFVNADGKNKVLLFDHATNMQVSFPEIKDGDVLGVIISPSEKNLLLTVGSSTSPANLYMYNLESKELK